MIPHKLSYQNLYGPSEQVELSNSCLRIETVSIRKVYGLNSPWQLYKMVIFPIIL